MIEQRSPVVLIVDDVMENIQVVASHLRDENYELLFATDGASALDTLQEGGVDLILLDVMMPGINGFQTCERIKQQPRTQDIPVIFLTAKADTESLVNGFNAGGVDYITKPFKAEELKVRVRNHLRLRRSEHELRSLLAAKDRFLSIIAGELSAPFSGLRGMLGMLAQEWRELPAEDLDDYLRMADSTANTMQDLLDNLLSWARLQTGGFAHHPRPLPLADLLNQALALLQADIERKQILVELSLEEGTEVFADPDMLEKVLLNLISNAIKYSDRKGRVQIKARRDAGEVAVEISDEGQGIPAENLDSLFRLDQHCIKPGTDGESGSGLGLMLSRALVEQQGGIISLSNRDDGQGVKARFTLPMEGRS